MNAPTLRNAALACAAVSVSAVLSVGALTAQSAPAGGQSAPAAEQSTPPAAQSAPPAAQGDARPGSAAAGPRSTSAGPSVPALESRIVSAGLFKNGLAVVRRAVTLPGPGTFEVGDAPDPVHGTFWIESLAPVDALVTEREVEEATDGRWDQDPQRELAGRDVTIYLRGDGMPEISGRVRRFEAASKEQQWSRAFEQDARRNYWWGMPFDAHANAYQAPPRYLAVDAWNGTTYVDVSTIAYLRTNDPPATRKRMKPVLRLTQRDVDGPVEVELTYLTKGLSYAPSYRLDIADPETLAIAETAVVRNELEDLRDVEVQLISGFPSMEFSHVLSPLSSHTSWADFFTQLGREIGSSLGRGAVMTQQVMSNVASYGGAEGQGAIEAVAEGVDLWYRSIGRRDLAAGESMHVPVAASSAAYERIAEWTIPDTRDEWGRRIDRSSWERASGEEGDGAWDALRFENPFDFPMTTAPATIVAGERFQGQRLTKWVNPGEQATVRITKALSLRTTTVEHETEAERELVRWGGRNFRNVGVVGEVQVCNHRKEAVTLVIRREFSGKLSRADGEPQTKLLERGVYSLNRRQELVWTIVLAPGEERLLTYAYDVLVSH